MSLGLCLGAASSGAEEHGCLGEALKIWQSVQGNGFSSVVAMFSSNATIVAPGRRVSGLTPELSSFREGPGPSAKDEGLQACFVCLFGHRSVWDAPGVYSGVSLPKVLTKQL